jgi:hypothetical protein
MMLTWKIKQLGNKWEVIWSDGIIKSYSSEQKALEAINSKFFDSYF